MRPTALAISALLACSLAGQTRPEPLLIPRPASLVMEPGSFPITPALSITVNTPEIRDEARSLRNALAPLLPEPPMVLPPVPVEGPFIAIELEPGSGLPPSGYRLHVHPRRVSLSASDAAGVFHGIQTILQLLPPAGQEPTLPCLEIIDQPRSAWRGMHLDVSRHFFEVDFVKKYIDLLARYKMNIFHWHLTDDQGWRIEIKKYPKLTEVGAWRSGSQIGPYAAQTFDTLRYGGFYTQDEIREVVAYAAERHVTVVPEIEMPGHAMAALASYAHLGCTGGPYEVQQGWGVFPEVFCPGNDSVFTFLEDVLSEVMALFPGEYIHIGGDECPKTRWKACEKCQARMLAEGLEDEHELQSYFIKLIEEFVNSRGRKIIGWDEIQEGGLAPNAAVMSWRGTEGGIAAAKAGHYAVMSPGSHCYFDHYQGDPAHEPLAFGGYTTVQKVYGYEPVPEALSKGEAKYILGAQGNVWTEYILTPEHVDYMAVPRMLALAEVLWTPKEKRNEADFIRRLEAEFPRLEAMGANYAKSMYQVQFKLSQGKAPGTILIQTPTYARGGVKVWQEPDEVLMADGQGLVVRSDAVLKAHSFFGEPSTSSDTSTIAIHFNLATARPITLSNPPHERYNSGGTFTLVDGIQGSSRRVDNEWLAWQEDVTITVDLGEVQDIMHIGIGALGDTHSWIHLPREVIMSVSSDGKNYTEVSRVQPKAGATGKVDLAAAVQTEARQVRLEVRSAGTIPEDFPGAGNPAWTFLDEIEVR